MSDYSKSVIYKIHNDDICYIGSTHHEYERERKHKSDCNNENGEHYNTPVYKHIRENGGWDNWKFEVIEEYPCDNRTQLRIRERDYYDLLNPELNMIRPYISEEEMKEERTQRSAKHYQDNREEIIEKHAKYNEEHTEEIKENKANYYQKNIEVIKEKTSKYRGNNKEKIYRKCICVCGKEYRFNNKARHCNSIKHKEFIKKLNIII